VAHDAFISYASEDKPTADAVCAAFEQEGIRCWIAPRDILPSQVWAGAIVDAINESHVLVVIFSAESNASNQVLREVECAVGRGIPILPFRISDVEMSPSLRYFLSTPHWLDAITPPLEQHIRKATRAVQVLLGTASPADVVIEHDVPPLAPPPFEEIAPDDWFGGRLRSVFRSFDRGR
jgi:hypothetical protein